MTCELRYDNSLEDCINPFGRSFYHNSGNLKVNFLKHPSRGVVLQMTYIGRKCVFWKQEGKWVVEIEARGTKKNAVFMFDDDNSNDTWEKIYDDLHEKLEYCKSAYVHIWDHMWPATVPYVAEMISACIEAWNCSMITPIYRWISSGCPIGKEDHKLYMDWPVEQDPIEWIHSIRGKRLSTKFGI